MSALRSQLRPATQTAIEAAKKCQISFSGESDDTRGTIHRLSTSVVWGVVAESAWWGILLSPPCTAIYKQTRMMFPWLAIPDAKTLAGVWIAGLCDIATL